MTQFDNREQAQFWDGMAAIWTAIEDRIEFTADAPGRQAMAALDPHPGQRLLDIGCGTGTTSLALAEKVGADGEVVGADISSEMVARAKERARNAAVGNVSFVNADMQSHVFDTTFDGAFSRFGVMFFTDPVRAFRNIRAALRPGGTLSFACWQQVFANEWMLVPGMAAMSVTGTPPPMPAEGEPGPFSPADPDATKALLADAGYRDAAVQLHNDELAIAESEIPAYADASLNLGAAREALRDADETTRSKTRAAVETALRERLSGGEVRVTRGYLVVSAKA